MHRDVSTSRTPMSFLESRSAGVGMGPMNFSFNQNFPGVQIQRIEPVCAIETSLRNA